MNLRLESVIVFQPQLALSRQRRARHIRLERLEERSPLVHIQIGGGVSQRQTVNLNARRGQRRRTAPGRWIAQTRYRGARLEGARKDTDRLVLGGGEQVQGHVQRDLLDL